MTLQLAAGLMDKLLTVSNPGTEVPDGMGGWTTTPAVVGNTYGAVVPATVRDMERTLGAAVQATASHLVTFWYLAGVSVKSTIVFHDGPRDRSFSISGLHDPDERHIQLVCACEEVLA